VKQRAKKNAKQQNAEVDQVFCMTADDGHVWIHIFDSMPRAVRQRLRTSPFNLCAACLKAFVLPEVLRKQPKLSHEKALLVGIEIMEAQVRKQTS
jgi:hypothetical protein